MTSSSTTSSSKTSPTKIASSVTVSNASTEPPSSDEPLHERDAGGDCGPMSEQDNSDAHGREMHPQKLVQLVGCHESDAEAARAARVK